MINLTYPDYKRGCGWIETKDHQSSSILRGHQSCDHLIIGAGVTGLSIASHLVSCGDDIRIIDAEAFGEGSSGRNSGFLIESVLAAKNNTVGSRLIDLYRSSHRSIIENAGWEPSDGVKGTTIIKGAATDMGCSALEEMAHFFKQCGQQFDWLNANQIARLTGSSFYKKGLQLYGNRLVNPYRLTTDLAKNLSDKITTYENTPAITIEQNKRGWLVTTPSGSLQTKKLYLANNAFAKQLGVGKGVCVTIYTYAGMTRPLPEVDRKRIINKQWGVLPAHRLGSTFRTTDDGRLLIRSMYGYEKEGGEEVKLMLEDRLRSRYGDLPESITALDRWWGGTTSLTSNGAPLWGEIKPSLYASIGCNGIGIVKGWMLGESLANLSLNKPHLDIPKLYGKPDWIPPEPFRKAGFTAISMYEAILAGNEK